MSLIATLTPNTHSSAASKEGKYYRPELDALRLFAFILVFAHHSHWPMAHPHLWPLLQNGSSGMCLFFMLSAFLITELLLREREKTGTIHARAFFVRRALRIWPLYFLALIIGIEGGMVVPAWHLSLKALPYLLLISGNFFVIHFGWQLGIVSPLWSLSIEEQFYLAIPSIAKIGGKRALAAIAIACIAVAYPTIVWLGFHGDIPTSQIWVNSLVQFQFFAAGTLLALALHNRKWSASLWVRATLFLVGLLGNVVAAKLGGMTDEVRHSATQLCEGYSLFLVSCTLIFLAFIHIQLKIPSAVRYLGMISYGLYVFHGMVLMSIFYTGKSDTVRWYFARQHTTLADVLAFVVTVGLASASFHLFEKRFLVLKERFAFVKSGTVVAALGSREFPKRERSAKRGQCARDAQAWSYL